MAQYKFPQEARQVVEAAWLAKYGTAMPEPACEEATGLCVVEIPA